MRARTIDKVKDMICAEVDKIADKGELSQGSLDTLYKLIVTYEKTLKSEMLEGDYGYSGADRGYPTYDYDNRRSSYRHSRSDGKEHIMDKLRDAMNDTTSESARETIRQCMNMLRDA